MATGLSPETERGRDSQHSPAVHVVTFETVSNVMPFVLPAALRTFLGLTGGGIFPVARGSARLRQLYCKMNLNLVQTLKKKEGSIVGVSVGSARAAHGQASVSG